MSEPRDVTVLLRAVTRGDDAAEAELLPLVYAELRRRAGSMMRAERASHTLQPTALVHESWMRLVRQSEVEYNDRTHFFALAARMMRRVLVDHARARAREKRGGDLVRVQIGPELKLSVGRDQDVIRLDEALQQLARLDERQASIVEMRFFGGLTVQEVADVLGISKRSVEAEWTMIKAWLRRELAE